MEDQRQRIGLLPALGQGGRELEAGVVRHQPVEQQRVDALRLGIGAHARIQIGRAALNQEHDCGRVPGPRVAAGQREQGRQSKQPNPRAPSLPGAPGLAFEPWENMTPKNLSAPSFPRLFAERVGKQEARSDEPGAPEPALSLRKGLALETWETAHLHRQSWPHRRWLGAPSFPRLSAERVGKQEAGCPRACPELADGSRF